MGSVVYNLKYKDSFYGEVYVDESIYYPRRFNEHIREIGVTESLDMYAKTRQIHHSGNVLMLNADNNALIPYKSMSKPYRQTI